jgi:hypothetical protein
MTTATLDVAAFLDARRAVILESAATAVQRRASLDQYTTAGAELATDRIRALLDVLIRCARERDVGPVRAYAEEIGVARRRAGIELAQVQGVINVLEEVIWKAVIDEVPPDGLAYALGIVSTILGEAKDRLACSYVSSVGTGSVKTLRVGSLFAGTEGGPSQE